MRNSNNLANQINQLTGFNLSYPENTIPTEGIYPGGVIKSSQILNIINALNGVSVDTIIISGSFLTSGSNVLDGTLTLPFIQEGQFLYVTGGFVQGTDAIPSSSYAVSSSYAATSSLALLGIVTASAAASTITFTRGDQTTFDIVVSQSGSVESASYAVFATNAATASYLLNQNVEITINSSTASIFLIQSQSLAFFNIASNSDATLYSDLFIVKGFTSQQPVLTINGSILNIATHSFNPTGSTIAGNIYFTSSSMYIGLE
jgi:hypothetical protein